MLPSDKNGFLAGRKVFVGKACEFFRGALLLLEAFAGSQQVTYHADELLCFLQGVKVQERHLDIAVFPLDSVLLCVTDLRDTAFHGVSFHKEAVHIGKITCRYGGLCALNQPVDIVTYGCKFVNVLFRHRIEVVVYMFHAGFKHTFQTVDDLRATVATEMEPSVFFDGLQMVDFAHTENLLPTIAFPDALFFFDLVTGLAE